MPPKPILSREAVLDAALSLVRHSGMECVNARGLAELLGCSTKPLFRLYKSMEALKQDLLSRSNQYCSAYIQGYADLHTDYIGVALRYISFAKEEPNLFKALFMSQGLTRATLAHMMADEDIAGLLDKISADAQITRREAQIIYQKMWVYAHGLASLAATNGDLFALEEARAGLVDAYQSFVLWARQGGQSHVPVTG